MRDNKNDPYGICKKIIRTLPLEVLEGNLVKVYKKYAKIYMTEYRSDCLDHLNQDPRKLRDDELQEIKTKYKGIYFVTVIQNGFFLFILIC